MKTNNFICKVTSELLDDDFSVLIHQKKNVNDCGGWFDPYNREFVVSMKNKMGFEILIHEYCHYIQWKIRRRWFGNRAKACGIVFEWIDGKNYSKKVLDKAFRDVLELELDCELNSIALIKSYKLDVDIEKYVNASNAYLLFYQIVRKHRKWCRNGSPYNSKIMKLMDSTHKPLDYYLDINNITEKQQKEYLKILG